MVHSAQIQILQASSLAFYTRVAGIALTHTDSSSACMQHRPSSHKAHNRRSQSEMQ